MAGGKMRPVGGENDHLDLIVLRGSIERIVELIEEVSVLRIAGGDAIQDDASDVCGRSFVGDVVESLHSHSPSRVAAIVAPASEAQCLHEGEAVSKSLNS